MATTVDRAEINRRNAQKSTGPRTDAGKSRSRMNALKHGMTAELPVLPGEDASALEARIAAWIEQFGPRPGPETYLVERAAQLSWQVDRIQRAHVARLSAAIVDQVEPGPNVAELDKVEREGHLLFFDRRGPVPLYPSMEPIRERDPRTSWSGLADDPGDPARVLCRLEATATGCDWLIKRWEELRTKLNDGLCWKSPDKLKAIRLLGKQPLDAVENSRVAMIFRACHVIDPALPHAFSELDCELTADQQAYLQDRMAGWPPGFDFGGDAARARRELIQIVEQSIARLQSLVERFQIEAEIQAMNAPRLLAFDDSDECRRLRRYETTCNRLMLQMLAEFRKIHDRATLEGKPLAIPEVAPGANSVPSLAVPAAPAQPAASPMPKPDNTLRRDAPPAAPEKIKSRNEATTEPAGDRHTGPDRPMSGSPTRERPRKPPGDPQNRGAKRERKARNRRQRAAA